MAQQPPAGQEYPLSAGDSEKKDFDNTSVRYLLFLQRYARSYGRKALEGTPLGNLDEFIYLSDIQKSGPMGKTELIHRNRHEKPTGMEIIRRLLDLGLIVQKDDARDRRSKILSLTDEGTALLARLEADVHKVFRLIAGNLSTVERFQLMYILEKLERFHQVVQAKLREKR